MLEQMTLMVACARRAAPALASRATVSAFVGAPAKIAQALFERAVKPVKKLVLCSPPPAKPAHLVLAQAFRLGLPPPFEAAA